jgi:glycosyltransferase involved in cell wall biosynthesis
MPHGSFARDGICCRPHKWLLNALPALLGDGLVPPLLQLSWQPFFLGPRLRFAQLEPVDVVQFEFCAHGAWMERLRGRAKVVYSAHNVEYDYARAQPWPRGLRTPLLNRMRALEARAVRASHLVLTCTQNDGERLSNLYGGGAALEVVPHGFDAALLGFDRQRERKQARAALGIPEDHQVVLFVGGASHQSREAADVLVRDIAPRLGPKVTLLMAGLCALGLHRENPSIRPLGFVEDLRVPYAAADVAVNPARQNSGASTKIVQYLAAGLPVITTPGCLSGYQHLRDHLQVAELEDFSEAIAACRSATGFADRTPLHDLTWTAIGRRLHRTYETLVARS